MIIGDEKTFVTLKDLDFILNFPDYYNYKKKVLYILTASTFKAQFIIFVSVAQWLGIYAAPGKYHAI